MAIKDDYFTITEAAKELHVTRQTVSRWLAKGNIEYEKVGREILVDKLHINSLYNERMIDQFTESIGWWMRKAVFNYLQEKCYVDRGYGMVIWEQTSNYIKVQGKDSVDGLDKIFTIPVKNMEFGIDIRNKRFFYIKNAKVIRELWSPPDEKKMKVK